MEAARGKWHRGDQHKRPDGPERIAHVPLEMPAPAIFRIASREHATGSVTAVRDQRVDHERQHAEREQHHRGHEQQTERPELDSGLRCARRARLQRRRHGRHEIGRRRWQPAQDRNQRPVQGNEDQRPHQTGEDRNPDQLVQDEAAQQHDDDRGQRDAFAGCQIIAVLAEIAEHGGRCAGTGWLARGPRIIGAVRERRGRAGAGRRGLVGRPETESVWRQLRPAVVRAGLVAAARPAASLLVNQVSELPI
jgi:hypothetical protein